MQQCDPNVTVFEAGTSLKDDVTITNGGRVLMVTCVADSLVQARTNIMRVVDQEKVIWFENAFYRTDIAQKGIDFERNKFDILLLSKV